MRFLRRGAWASNPIPLGREGEFFTREQLETRTIEFPERLPETPHRRLHGGDQTHTDNEPIVSRKDM